MMKPDIKTVSVIMTLFIISVLLVNFTVDPIPRLISLSNLGDFYYADNGYDIQSLSEHINNQEKLIRSISVYRYSSAAQNMLLQDSILMDKNGRPVARMTPYESGTSTTYYFYDDRGNRFLDVTVLQNKYDTLYTLRKFDRFNRENISIQYNITRKELGYLNTVNIVPASDKEVTLKLVKYEPDINYKIVLPFESRDMLIKHVEDSLVQVNTNRIVYNDTSYNSTYKNLFRIENNYLVPEKAKTQLTFNSQGDWIEKKNNQFDIQRKFSYYTPDHNEIKTGFSADVSVLNYLYSQMDSLPPLAWANYREKQNSFELRSSLFENGNYEDSIVVKDGNTIEAFTPKLWYLVSTGSGIITGIDSLCYAAAYNTPVKSNDDYYKRCLAIYERRNGRYRLIKQSFGAIEDFYDADNDLLFDGFEETNLSVNIDNGDVIITNEYMRGEASYEFAYTNGNWILVSYSSGHRTCCQSESESYDYRTKTYSSSIYKMGDDEDYNESEDMPRDTSITVIEERPIIYMDSLTIKL